VPDGMGCLNSSSRSGVSSDTGKGVSEDLNADPGFAFHTPRVQSEEIGCGRIDD
jgi:hypothetical protein